MRKPVVIGLIDPTPQVLEITDNLPSNELRSSITHSLITSYNLQESCDMIAIRRGKVTRKLLQSFHDKKYIRFLMKSRPQLEEDYNDYKLGNKRNINDGWESCRKIRKIGNARPLSSKEDEQKKDEEGMNNETPDEDKQDEDKLALSEEDLSSEDEPSSSESENSIDLNDYSTNDEKHQILEKYSLIYDCPLFPTLPDYIKIVTSSTIESCKWLVKQSTNNCQPIAINWLGGRHHAKRAKASGFCYVNDIVLGIQYLRTTKYKKVIYIDLDLHYGDGVAEAFKYSNKVVTVSFHYHDAGLFFPFCGSVEERGQGNGENYCVNIPLKQGLSNGNFEKLVKSIITPLIEEFGGVNDCVIVLQCGLDGLFNDQHFKKWNLSIDGMVSTIIKHIVTNEKQFPVVLLGGGGYSNTNSSRFWCFMLKELSKVSNPLNNVDLTNIPMEEKFLDLYENESHLFWGVNNSLQKASMRKDLNSTEYLQEIVKIIRDRNIK
ncbi:histone deacetylase [Saccharomycopsis crataegensis]|uniref:histone deacetylase n=1 Tax=Saccharomycopsis crataegensis TaxID=43959 RepID=A0AAV5QLV7_9ASCO|nr:histone deacetylase [Saccharomycopsis crataegensis]